MIRGEYPDLPFLLFTGHGSEEVASEAISAGTTDYIQKEGGTEQYEVLTRRVQNAVSRYQTNRLLEDTINSVEASIFVVDEHDHYLLMNREARDLLGIGGETQVVGKTNDELFSGGTGVTVPREQSNRRRKRVAGRIRAGSANSARGYAVSDSHRSPVRRGRRSLRLLWDRDGTESDSIIRSAFGRGLAVVDDSNESPHTRQAVEAKRSDCRRFRAG